MEELLPYGLKAMRITPLLMRVGQNVCFYNYHNTKCANSFKVEVEQHSFTWDLQRSKKLNASGKDLGCYKRKDMKVETFCHDQNSKRTSSYYTLEYDLIWQITEMQLKIGYRPHFHKAKGPATIQLAGQPEGEFNDKYIPKGPPKKESRSKDLEIDIKYTEQFQCRERHSEKVSIPGGLRSNPRPDDTSSEHQMTHGDNFADAMYASAGRTSNNLSDTVA
jgi:hypothetical protein